MYRRYFNLIMANQLMRAILIEPGQEPSIIRLPAGHGEHEAAIQDVLEGNYGAVEFFEIQPGISLFILVNDLAAVLGMQPNRRFPEPDQDQIIYGKAIFIAAHNGAVEGQEGTLDMAEETCLMFMEQIKLHFPACKGDEAPRPEDTLYYDEDEEGNQVPYRWIEISKPADLPEPLQAGRVKFYRGPVQETMEVNNRFFKKIAVYTPGSNLN